MLDLLKRLRKATPIAAQEPPNPSPAPATAPDPTQPDLAPITALVASLYSPATVDAVIDAVHAAGFSETDYYQANPDLQAVFGSVRHALLHFLAMVNVERRRFPIRLDLAGMAAVHALPSDDRTIVANLLASLADAAAAMGNAPDLARLRQFWPQAEALRELGAKPYLVLGDSHSAFYRRGTARGAAWLLPLHVCCSGGSAIGLANPNSRSGYGRQLEALAGFLAAAGPDAAMPVMIQFGQVDLEFVHPFRRIRRRSWGFDAAEFAAFSASSVRAYVGFLETLFAADRRANVTLLGVFPPAIKDAPLGRGHVNFHIAGLEDMADRADLKASLARLDWPDLATRTRLHAAHNARLEAAATASGFRFVADFDRLLSRDGVLDDRFIPTGQGDDHHLDFTPSAAPLTETVWRVLEPDRPVVPIHFTDLAELPDPALLPPLDRPGLARDGLSADQLSWVDTGVVIKRGFIPDAVLDPYIARRAGFRPGTAWNAVGWPDGNCYEGIPELRDIALHPPLMALMESLLGEPMLFHLTLTGWLSTERDWHQDDYLNPDFINTWYIAVWIALDTITPESGPFEYVPGSHQWPLLRGEKVRRHLTEEELSRKTPNTKVVEWPKYAERFVSPAIEEQIRSTGLPVLPFLAEKGDVLVWHSRLMHRGSKRTEEWLRDGDKVYSKYPRKSLITHYSGINHRPDMPTRAQDRNGQSYAVFNTPVTLD